MLRYLLLALLSSLTLPVAAQAIPPTPLVALPFDVVNGIIVLRNLPFNGRRGDFILDTGCTYGLVVEQTAFPSQLRPSARAGLGPAGATPLYELPVTQFELGDLRPPQLAQAASLAGIRAAIGPQVLGLIGTGLLRRFEVVIDYAHRRLSIYALGQQQSQARPFARRDSLAFVLEKGWPITRATVGSTPVQLLLDTGARDSYLDTDFAQALPKGNRPVGMRREAVATPGGRLAVQRATLPVLRVGTRDWRGMPVLLAAPVRYGSGRKLPYQGVLGSAFLRQEPLVSFHYGRGYFYTLAPTRP